MLEFWALQIVNYNQRGLSIPCLKVPIGRSTIWFIFFLAMIVFNLVVSFTTIRTRVYKLGLMIDLKAWFCLALECLFVLDPKEWNNYRFVSSSTITKWTTPFTPNWGWVLNITLQLVSSFKGLCGGVKKWSFSFLSIPCQLLISMFCLAQSLPHNFAHMFLQYVTYASYPFKAMKLLRSSNYNLQH